MLRMPLLTLCKVFPSQAKEHLIPPEVSPANAWLLATAATTSALTPSVLSSLVSLVQQLTRPSNHAKQYWQDILSVTSEVVRLVEYIAESAPLTLTLFELLLEICQQVANTHWQCCIDEASQFIELVSAAISQNSRHASERSVVGTCQ